MTMPSAKLKCGAALRLDGSRAGLMYSPLFRVTLKVKALMPEFQQGSSQSVALVATRKLSHRRL